MLEVGSTQLMAVDGLRIISSDGNETLLRASKTGGVLEKTRPAWKARETMLIFVTKFKT